MQLHRPLRFAEARPRKDRQTQVNGARVERIDRVLQLQSETALCVEPTGDAAETQSKVLVNAPVALFVGVGQSAAGDATPDAQVVELGRVRSQAGLDVSQALPIGQLRENHAQVLIQMREGKCWIVSGVSRDTPAKRVQRQMLHQLSEYQFPRIHRNTSGKSRQCLAYCSRLR
jgi:hypothetical protein